MKDKIIYLCVIVLLSVSCQEQTFQVDDIILECYDTEYQKEGYDIKTIIEDYEKLLLENGILKDVSRESYLELMRKINSDKEFRILASPFMEYDPFFKVDNDTKLAIFECENQMMELAKEKNSIWYKFSNFKASETKDNPDLMYQFMMENLSENDFNSYYFKLKMFNLFDMVNPKWGKAMIEEDSTY